MQEEGELQDAPFGCVDSPRVGFAGDGSASTLQAVPSQRSTAGAYVMYSPAGTGFVPGMTQASADEQETSSPQKYSLTALGRTCGAQGEVRKVWSAL